MGAEGAVAEAAIQVVVVVAMINDKNLPFHQNQNDFTYNTVKYSRNYQKMDNQEDVFEDPKVGVLLYLT